MRFTISLKIFMINPWNSIKSYFIIPVIWKRLNGLHIMAPAVWPSWILLGTYLYYCPQQAFCSKLGTSKKRFSLLIKKFSGQWSFLLNFQSAFSSDVLFGVHKFYLSIFIQEDDYFGREFWLICNWNQNRGTNFF